MKIGDKVRFLSEVGGGRVCGFQQKDIVLVEDEDGFEIPMLRSEVVVVDDSDYDIGKVHTIDSPKPTQNKNTSNQKEPKKEKETTFVPKPIERKGADLLNLYLCFLPDDVKQPFSTGFEAYIVNDSNYYVQVLYMSAESAGWKARFCATIEPNSKVFVEEFDHSILNELERICIQAIAWKQDKTYEMKPALSSEIRLDCTKFYKLHIFQPDEFFTDPCWTVPVIKDDKPIRTTFADASQIREALLGGKNKDEKTNQNKNTPAPKKQNAAEEIVTDLHAEELLETTAGLSAGDILTVQMNEFRRVMDEHTRHAGRKIVFIHGKGEGVLRKNIIQELKYRYKHCTWQDASFREYGYGATLVKIGNKKQ